jgi:hypothetical protein
MLASYLNELAIVWLHVAAAINLHDLLWIDAGSFRVMKEVTMTLPSTCIFYGLMLEVLGS